MNKVKGLDGREYHWNLTGHMISENDLRPRSSYHLRCRILLKRIFPVSPICEEVSLPGTRKQTIDFYLPHQRIGIEVQGEQHYSMISHFHKNKKAFIEAQKLDVEKARWCEINNVRYIALAHYDSDERWFQQITAYC